MSAGLQLRPLLRLTPIRLRLLRSPISAATPPPSAHGGDDVACRTPTSSENKIPAMLSCPPAPRKSRPVTDVRCKRKLEFFETDGGDEIETFFKENFESIDGKRKKLY